jgi:hypothetical protein
VPYEADDALLRAHIDRLVAEMPAIANPLRTALEGRGTDDTVARINDVLTQIGRKDPRLKPPEAAYLTSREDGSLWSR